MTDRCEVCGGGRHERLFAKAGYDVVRCRQCGHIFVPLAMSDSDLIRMYETQFFTNGAYSDYARDKAVLQRNFGRFVRTVRAYRPEGSLLEIGAAFGFFLELARRHWRVEGVEIAREAARFARERLGLEVTCGDFLDIPIPPSSYEVVTMWDTVEHLRRPGDYIAKVSRILKPGGVLALTTGDVGSLVARMRGWRWRLYHPPFHLHYFSRSTIAALLGRHGLRVIEVRPVGFYRSLDTMLYRMCFDGKPAISRAVYRAAKRTGLTGYPLYLNLFDIMLVIARRT